MTDELEERLSVSKLIEQFSTIEMRVVALIISELISIYIFPDLDIEE